jgi:hypothetical protein
MQRLTTASGDIETKDIMYTLLMALPAAVDSLILVPGIEQVFQSSDVPINAARFLRERVTYKEDGLTHQTIQLPNALFESGFGDCKSFSLFISAVLTKASIKNGFRFAAYAPGDFTHVYNFFLDNSKNLVYLDACLPNLIESNKAVKVENMEVSIIGRTPIAHKASTKISGVGNILTTIGMAPVRSAFRALVALNFRGFASAFQLGLDNGKRPLIEAFWSNFGGTPSQLLSSIQTGNGKAPLLGGGDASDAAFAQTIVAENTATQQQILELLTNANLLGANFPITTYNLENPQIFSTVVQALNAFYNELGVRTANQLNVALIRNEALPTRPPVIIPGSGPSRGPIIGTGAETAAAVATVVGIAVPILTVLPNFLRSIGVNEGGFLNTLDNVANSLGGLLPPNTPIEPGAPDENQGTGLSSFFTLPNILIFGGIFYFLTRKKR